jgi:hypothetical protein
VACALESGLGACQGQRVPSQTTACILDALDEDCDATTPGAHVWSTGISGPYLQRAHDADLDGAGNVFVTGYTWGHFALSPTVPLGMYLLKLDESGNVLWAKGYEPLSNSGVAVAAWPSGEVAFAGLIKAPVDFGGGMLSPTGAQGISALVKLTGSGAHVWSVAPGALLSAIETSTAAAGRLLVAGTFSTTLSWPGAPPLSAGTDSHGFVARIDSDGDGDAVWTRSYGESVTIHRVDEDTKNNVLVTGRLIGAADLGGGSIGFDGSGFIAKLDKDGEHVWSHALGVVPQFNGKVTFAVASDDSIWLVLPFSGSLTIAGTTLASQGDNDIAVVHFDPSGAFLAAKRFGGTGVDLPWSVAVDSKDHLVIGGTFDDTIDIGACDASAHECSAGTCADAFLLKLDPTGEPSWLHAFGDAADQAFDSWWGDMIVAVDVRADDGIVSTGVFTGTVDWSGGVGDALSASDDHDVFVARHAP